MSRIVFRLFFGAFAATAWVLSLAHVSNAERADCAAKHGTVNEWGRTPNEEKMFRDHMFQNEDLVRTTSALQAAMIVRTQEIASTATTVKICVPDTIMEGEEGSPYRVEPNAPCRSLYNNAVVFPVVLVDGLPTIGTPTVNGEKLGVTIIYG